MRFKSSIDGIVWPAVPEPQAAALLAILFQLEQSQWWSPAELRRRQAEQLALLVEHARRTVPFYRDRFRAYGGEAADPASEEPWLRLPLLHRSDIQAARDALLSREIPPHHGQTSEIYTSGSTGKPIKAVRTQFWELFWSAFTIRDHFWHRRDLSGKLATIRETAKGKASYPAGERAAGWGPSSEYVFATGPCVNLNAMTRLEQQAEWLQREDPDYLLTHPSIVHRLAEFCLRHGIRLPRLRQVETIAEILRPATREACKAAWNVPIVDVYSAREAGYIALQCPEHEHYHVQAEGILVEVLDHLGRPCRAGELGRVVVTPLHNFAMPLIRYDIGDFAVLGEACPCGRGLPVLKRILGRKQNMLVLPSGERRWPLLSSGDIRALLGIAPIRQYQFVQKSLEAMELRLALERPLQGDEEQGLRRWVEEKFGHPFAVAFAIFDEIPRPASGKFEDFIGEVERAG